MKKILLKNTHGITLINAIILIFITILVVLLAYEIVFADILGIMEQENDNPLSVLTNPSNLLTSIYQNTEDNSEEVEVITPIIGETNYQLEENTSTVNHFYYQQLDSTAKIIYKGLEDNIENMQTGNYKIDFKTQFSDLLNSEDGEKTLNIAFQSAWNAFTYDYVDIFYIDVTKLILTTQTTTIGSFSTHKVDLSSGDNANYFNEGITSATDLQNKKAYIEKVRQQIVSQLDGYSEYQQLKYLHDWIIDNFKYDTTYQNSDAHNIFGAFTNKEVVCEGYARAFKYILDDLGIESVLVSGTATNSQNATESHAWNYVKLNGKWYAVDVTWDDPVIENGRLTDELRYRYFLKGSNDFLVNHKEDGYLSPNSMKFKFPTLEKENY